MLIMLHFQEHGSAALFWVNDINEKRQCGALLSIKILKIYHKEHGSAALIWEARFLKYPII